jgi:hypothetical protein
MQTEKAAPVGVYFDRNSCRSGQQRKSIARKAAVVAGFAYGTAENYFCTLPWRWTQSGANLSLQPNSPYLGKIQGICSQIRRDYCVRVSRGPSHTGHNATGHTQHGAEITGNFCRINREVQNVMPRLCREGCFQCIRVLVSDSPRIQTNRFHWVEHRFGSGSVCRCFVASGSVGTPVANVLTPVGTRSRGGSSIVLTDAYVESCLTCPSGSLRSSCLQRYPIFLAIADKGHAGRLRSR